MPKDIRNWSTCIPQGEKDAGQTLMEYLVPDYGGDWLGTTLGVTIFGFLSGAVPAGALVLFVEKVLHKTVEGGCVLGAIFLGGMIYFLVTLALWFDNKRTICMDTAACAVGTIVHDPHNNFNGDLDLDIAVAPFSPSDQQDAIRAALKSQAGVTPSSGWLNTYIALAGLSPKTRLQVYEHAVEDHYLKWPADRLYQRKYFESTPFLDPLIQSKIIKKPLYRCPSDAEDASEKLPIPSSINDAVLQNTFVYLPCVIEGHVVVEWLKNARNALIAVLVGFVIGCAICIYYTGDEHNCAYAGAAVGGVLGFLIWLLSHFFNDPDDTKADGSSGTQPPAGGSTPTGSPITSSAERGDVILAIGSWVMYRLDNQYYEIHPVHAWYLICRGDQLFEKGTISPEGCRFDPSRLRGADYDIICRMAHAAEAGDPAHSLTQTVEGGLAMAGGLH